MQKVRRYPLSYFLRLLVWLAAAVTAGILLFLLAYILGKGIPNLTPSLFAWKSDSENVSMLPALLNTVLMVVMTLLLAVPIGLFSAIYLVEYAGKGNRLVKIIRLMTETLAGIPSIVYGLFGYLMFVVACKFGLSMLSGALTLSMMVLPTILRTSEESLLSVPETYREGSFGLGAGKLRTVFRLVLPAAAPGIVSGVILAIGRIVGETAALIYTAGAVARLPKGLLDSGSTLSVHMYTLLSEGFYTKQAYATAVVLLLLVLGINLLSGWVGGRMSGGRTK